jgi:putative membrane protein insertion efficiency factor
MSESPAASALSRVPRVIVMGAIQVYRRAISPLLPRSCRFYPTCSAYALTSVDRFGVLKGGWMAARRLARCHPFSPGGYDPVPDAQPRKH